MFATSEARREFAKLSLEHYPVFLVTVSWVISILRHRWGIVNLTG